MFSSNSLFQFSSLFSLVGLILAVAILTVALLVINGFSSGLEKTLIGKQGHLRIFSEENVSEREVLERIKPYQSALSSQALFFSFEGLILYKHNFKGVFFEAIQDEKLKTLSFLKNRIIEGSLMASKEPFVLVGSDLAQELNLSIGSEVLVLVSRPEDSYFSKKTLTYKLSAIVDFGRYEYNSRFVLMPLSSVQALGKDQVSGVSLWLKKKEQTEFFKKQLKKRLKDSYFVYSWKEVDEAFFNIIESDKKIIFFVLLILIIVAGFNVSSSLFVQVSRKTRDINILKAMGAKQGVVRNIFLLKGLILGVFGTIFGLLLGLLFCYMLLFAQEKWRFLPAKVYEVNEVVLDWQNKDLVLIFVVSLIVVLLSSYIPARRAYKMAVRRGLSRD